MAETEDVGGTEDALKSLSLNGHGAEPQEAPSENSVSGDEENASQRSKASEGPANGHYGTEAVDKSRRVVSIGRNAASVSELRCVPFVPRMQLRRPSAPEIVEICSRV